MKLMKHKFVPLSVNKHLTTDAIYLTLKLLRKVIFIFTAFPNPRC